MITLLELPNEIFTLILLQLSTTSLVALSLTCRRVYVFINNEAGLVWKQLYLRNWDMDSDEASSKELVAHRRRARRDLAKVVNDPIRLVQTHSHILQELIDAQRSIVLDGSTSQKSRAVASLCSMFPQNEIGDARWAALVYPRPTLKAFKQLQQSEGDELMAYPRQKDVPGPQVPHKRHHIADDPSALIKRRKTKDGQQEGRANEDTQPPELHRLLTLASLASSVRDSIIEEEKAAELHCLAGLRCFIPGRQDESVIFQIHTERLGNDQAAKLLDEDFLPFQQGDAEEEAANRCIPYEARYEDWEASLSGRISPQRCEQTNTCQFSLWGTPHSTLLRSAAKKIVYDVSRSAYENSMGPLKPFRKCVRPSRDDFANQSNFEDPQSDAEEGFTEYDELLAGILLHRGSRVASELRNMDVRSDVDAEQNSATDRESSSSVTECGPSTADSGWLCHKQIDWLRLEAIMIVMQCNIAEAISTGWGESLSAPRMDSMDEEPSSSSERRFRTLQVLDNTCCWARSKTLLDCPLNAAESESVVDWAGVESRTWAGGDFYMKYGAFLQWNARLAKCSDAMISRVSAEHDCPYEPEQQPEHPADAIELRLSLLSSSGQESVSEELQDEAKSHGPEDLEYPTLRFEGLFFAHVAGADALPKYHTVRGFCQPVYTADQTPSRYHAPSNTWLPAIAGIHWNFVQEIEGVVTWNLSGIQVGPPGTRALILGLWTNAEDNVGYSGPFAFYQIDQRPWREVEECRRKLRQERTEHI